MSSALFLLAGGALAGCSRAEASTKPGEPPPTVSVTTVDVAERSIPKLLTVTGTLVGNRESDVAADVAGRVLQTNVERGAVVQKGEILARLDARGAALSRSEALAQAQAARVQKETSALECDRAERLFRANAISQAELDRARASCRASDHSTAALVARQYMAEKELSDSNIRAPFAGMIVERDVSIGEYVTVGKRIATVVELDPLRLELTVPEIGSTAVRVGSEVAFQVKAFPNERFTATVRYIGPVLRRATRDMIVEAVVDNHERRLMPGMFAEAELKMGEQRLPVVPKAALSGSEPSVRAFAVVNGVIEERVVLTGSSEGNDVAILKGLRPGDRVVSKPDKSVVDGARVK